MRNVYYLGLKFLTIFYNITNRIFNSRQNGIRIIVIIIVVTAVFVFSLVAKNTLSVGSTLSAVFHEAIPAGKQCNISGDIWSYSGQKNKASKVPCSQCIDYIAKTKFGCTPMKFDKEKSCQTHGDPRPCPLNPTTYAKYTVK